jgi:hypothetical protein
VRGCSLRKERREGRVRQGHGYRLSLRCRHGSFQQWASEGRSTRPDRDSQRNLHHTPQSPPPLQLEEWPEDDRILRGTWRNFCREPPTILCCIAGRSGLQGVDVYSLSRQGCGWVRDGSGSLWLISKTNAAAGCADVVVEDPRNCVAEEVGDEAFRLNASSRVGLGECGACRIQDETA